MARQINFLLKLSIASAILHTGTGRRIANVSSWLTTILGLFALAASPAPAQSISVDSAAGETNTLLNSGASCSGTCSISGGTSNSTGNNLFHSFSRFNVDTDATVTFEDPGVTNIFGRVTGDSLSNIDGTLRVEGAANLYLLNPNGIVFGEKAKLDIRGSFLSTTAESILFEKSEEFSAVDQDLTSLLSVSVPLGLQFGATAAPIAVSGDGHALTYDARGSFTVARSTPSTGLIARLDQSIALIGSGVTLQGGNVIAEGGTIDIGSVDSGSQIRFIAAESGWNFDYSGVENFEDVLLTQRSSVDVSGSDAGSVRISSQNLNIEGSSAILAKVEASGNGEIALNASEAINVVGEDLSGAQPMVTGASIEIANGAIGDGNSTITLSADTINLLASGQIGLGMAGQGAAGVVTAEASEINVDGGNASSPSSLYAAVLPGYLLGSGATGQGGDLIITADQLNVTNGAQISTSTFDGGNAGDLTVTASDVRVVGRNEANIEAVSSIRSASEIPPLNFLIAPGTPPSFILPSVAEGSGNSGIVTITTERLLVSEAGQIAVGTVSNNLGGSLFINASESIELSGGDANGRSGLFASALGDQRVPVPSTGTGGNIEINTRQLTLLDGATINVSTLPSQIQANSVRRPGEGTAGNIDIVATDISVKEGSLITADTAAGDRANIDIRSNSLVLREGGRISTNATGIATGGNITLNTEALIAFENSDITANATDNFGGRVVVNAPTILGTAYREALTSESDITATSALGPAFSGSVELNSPEVDPSEGTVELPEGLNAAEQIVAACEQIDANTFVATGRGGLPEEAGQMTSGHSLWSDFRLIEADNALAASSADVSRLNLNSAERGAESTPAALKAEGAAPVVEAQGWIVTEEGKIALGVHTAVTASTHQAQHCLNS